ncbi:MAG: saccharopine dehydrogenase NADP-binding domain-containing protein [Myxococcales bacterium]|nr:saccharopine dehydrogenase NADP-binding domain-containing protein [Myxococcales bacterium]
MQRYHRIAVLGAAGAVGRVLVRLLLENSDAGLVLAGRTKTKLDQLAKSFREHVDVARYHVAVADASDPVSMRNAFEGVDVVVNATTASRDCLTIARVCVEIGSDYLEMNLAQTLTPLADAAKARGVALIDQAGFHPGLPAPLIRWARARLDSLECARIFMAMDPDFETPLSALELVDAVGENRGALVRGGTWRRATYRDLLSRDFGGKWGKKKCFPLEMPELRRVAEEIGLDEAGVYAAGFNAFIDNVVFPINMLAYKIHKGWGRATLSRMIHWGAKRFSKPGSAVCFLLAAKGTQGGTTRELEARIDHDDALLFTAAPVLAAIEQLDDGSARRPGLEMMGVVVDPERLFRDLERHGIRIQSDLSRDAA